MKPKFTSDFFSGNRERLRQLFTGTAPIVVSANGLMQKGADEAYPFVQDASFWYLTGVNRADAILVMDKHKEYLIIPEREEISEIFDGTTDLDELAEISGIQDIYGNKTGWKHLGNRLKKVKHVATLSAAPARLKYYDMYTNPARHHLIEQMKDVNEDLEFLDLREHLGVMRRVKQPIEIAAIQRAIEITNTALAEVISSKEAFTYEYEFEAEITRLFRKTEGSNHAFSPIVAGGVRACTMHYLENDAKLNTNELLLFDVGAEVSGYSADIARTIALVAEPRHRQAAVHAAVQEALADICAQIKPGVTPNMLETQAELLVGEKLRELGLIKTIEHESVRKYYPHRAMHYLGLNTHDVGDYDAPLVQGVVLAVELGIYIGEEAIGVRIEDDVVVTETGVEVLSAKLARGL